MGVDDQSTTESNAGSSQYPNSGLTKEQYEQLIDLLQQFQVNDTRETNEDQMSNGAAHFAGMIACNSSIKFDNLSCGCFKTKTGLWILDSGTTHHITSNKSHLSNITILPYPLLVDLLNGYKVKVTEVRSMKLAPMIILHKVYFIPSFKYNLVSIKSLVAHLKCIAIFSDSSCMLQALSIKRPLDVGRAHDGLYFLCSTCL